ncbi:hypothetical protein [Caulobacter sp. B11]|uniref:hypothetical protein n=1 Tax=Caulobacter sp. B11 TaxID=2048899 RepID=UPI001181039E|nr:hypothetical protein [Caulobacter sp. B11]
MAKSNSSLIAIVLLISLSSGNIGYGICALVNDVGNGVPFLGIGGALLAVAGAMLARVNFQKPPTV